MRRTVRQITLLSMIGLVTACAHAPQAVTTSPDYAPITGDPAPPNARYYADCLGQATNTGAFRRASDGGGDELILFTCTGTPARAFWDALGPWSVRINSAFDHEGRRYRSTARVQSNLFGVDACSALANTDHRCVISFNAGDFLDGE